MHNLIVWGQIYRDFVALASRYGRGLGVRQMKSILTLHQRCRVIAFHTLDIAYCMNTRCEELTILHYYSTNEAKFYNHGRRVLTS